MADRYENIRKALAMVCGPEDHPKRYTQALTELRLACDPDTIRELLAERDADLKRLAFLSKEPVVEGFVGITKDVYDYACDCAEEGGRDEPDDEDMLNGMRRLIDAAIAAANGGGDE